VSVCVHVCDLTRVCSNALCGLVSLKTYLFVFACVLACEYVFLVFVLFAQVFVLCVYTNQFGYVRSRARSRACVHARACVHKCVCVYTYTHEICIYAHTYT